MSTKKAATPAKHKLYVSISNGGLYPPMRNVPGYEDAHPEDWRPATAAEIAQYEAGDKTTKMVPDEDEVDLTAPAPAAPTKITLADDDGGTDADAPPMLPAGALPPGPAFNKA